MIELLIAENNGKMAHAYRQFFMGHKGEIEARYTTNKVGFLRRLLRICRNLTGLVLSI